MNKKIITICLVITLFLMNKTVFAADIKFFKTNNNSIQFIVNANNDIYNAINGSISINVDISKIKGINNGNSYVNFWIENPKIENNLISFSGITPGGFSGDNKLIFTINFDSNINLDSAINSYDIDLYKNDGLGNSIKFKSNKVKIDDLKINVDNSKDLQLPEDFKPEVIESSDIFNNKTVLVFDTQDKGSGINHFEVKEGYFGDFKPAKSPYILENQGLNSKIYIKAIDNNKNERIIEYSPENYIKLYHRYEIIVIILLILLLFFFIKKWLKSST